MGPWGAMPIMALNVVYDLYVENTSLCKTREEGVELGDMAYK